MKKETSNQGSIVNDFLENLLCYTPKHAKDLIGILEELLPVLETEYNEPISEEYLNVCIDVAIQKRAGLCSTIDGYPLKKCLIELSNYRPEVHKQILKQAKIAIQKTISKQDSIAALCQDFTRIIQGLDTKSKFMYLALTEAVRLSGLNIDCFEKALMANLEDESENIISSFKSNPEYMSNPDLVFLSRLYDKAYQTNVNS